MRRHSFTVVIITFVITVFLIAGLLFTTIYSIAKIDTDRITAVEKEIEGVEYEKK